VQAALKSDPHAFDTRLLLASILLDMEAYADAEQHLRWCALRRPEHLQTRTLLKKTVKRRMSHAVPTTITPSKTATRWSSSLACGAA